MLSVRRLAAGIGVGLLMFLLHPATAVVQDLRGAVTLAATTPSELRVWDPFIDRMLRDGALQARQLQNDTLIPGRTHERLAQYYQGVPVFGGEIVRQLDGGLTISIFGTVYTDIALDPTPELSAEDAKAIIEGLAGAELAPSRHPELTVLPRTADGSYALTYRARILSQSDLTMYFIDARSGDVVLQFSDLKTQSAVGVGTGVLSDRKKISVRQATGTFLASDLLRPPTIVTYDMRGDPVRTLAFLGDFVLLSDSDLASDTDNVWTNGANVDGHVSAGLLYDYLFKRFGRRGLDDRDIAIRSLVHPVNRSDIFTASSSIISLFYLNAFYAGDGIVVYGEGLPPGFVLSSTGQAVNFLSAGLDVVAHELAHGVTDFSSQLIYQNESGALNEAFSDIIGTAVEFFFQTPGSGLLRADYLVGEDVVTPGGIRSMADPAAFGDPDHFSVRFTGMADNGGVHINSGIANHAFYLAVEGGTNRTSGLTVTGVGAANREQIEQVFYRAFVFMLPPTATFSVARACTIQAARDLNGAGSSVERAVIQAWNAVGVS